MTLIPPAYEDKNIFFLGINLLKVIFFIFPQVEKMLSLI